MRKRIWLLAVLLILCLWPAGCGREEQVSSERSEREESTASESKEITTETEEEEETSTVDPELLRLEELYKKHPRLIRDPAFQTDSLSYCVLDENGVIYLGKDEFEPLPPASITKVMTALIVAEKTSLDEIVTIEEEDLLKVAVMSSGVYPSLKPGEQFTVRDLLYALILPSTNSAGNALARFCAGSREAFVGLMNRKATELKLFNTHFMNPHGLDTEDHYSCSYDMAVILREALKNPEIRTIMGSGVYRLPATEYENERIMYMGHSMLNGRVSCHGVFAGKTGSSRKARNTLLTAVEREGKSFYVCTMHSKAGRSYEDTWNLIETAYGAYFDREPVLMTVVGDYCITACDKTWAELSFTVSGDAKKAKVLWYDTDKGPGSVKEVWINKPSGEIKTRLRNLSGTLYTIQVYVYDNYDREYPKGLVYVNTGKMKKAGYLEYKDAAYVIDEDGFALCGNAETDDSWYYADPTGRLVKGFAGGKFYAGNDYKIVTGWFTDANLQYYSGGDGRVVAGKRIVDGVLHEFSSYGALIR